MITKKLGLGMAVLAAVTLMISGIMVFGANTNDDAVYFPLKSGNNWTYKISMVGGTNSVQQKVKVTEPENNNPRIIVYDSSNNPVFIDYIENAQGLFKTKQMGPTGVLDFPPPWLVLSSKMNVDATWSWESSDHQDERDFQSFGH